MKIGLEKLTQEQLNAIDIICNMGLNDALNFESILSDYVLPEEYIRKYIDYIDDDYLSELASTQPLSIEFINDFKHKLDWNEICGYQVQLPESFIEENIKYIDEYDCWDLIPNRNLSEEFITKYLDKLDLERLLFDQKLSETLIRELVLKFNDQCWFNISHIQYLSEEFRNEFKDKLNLDDCKWLYMSEEDKKQKVIDTNEYECFDDYFIGYRSIFVDLDLCDLYGTVKYELEKVYETYADEYRLTGFSIFSKEHLENFKEEDTYVKVKVYYKDISQILINGVIKCSKMEVLEMI